MVHLLDLLQELSDDVDSSDLVRSLPMVPVSVLPTIRGYGHLMERNVKSVIL